MKKLLGTLLTLSLAAGPAAALPWHSMGPRAMGMGGAGVAIAQGPLASYWNPAGMGQLYNASGLIIPTIGIRAEATGLMLKGANDLFKLTQDCEAGNATTCTQANIDAAINTLNDTGNGVHVDVGGAVSLKIKRLAIFAHSLSYVGANPKVDTARTVACANGAADCIDQNQSRLALRGGVFTELGVGYAHELMETGLVLGGNIKGIVGKVGYNETTVISEDPETGGLGDFDTNVKTTIQPGADLGMFWDMRESFPSLPMRPRFGVVGRNINNPKFENPDAAKLVGERQKFPLHGQVRAGFALAPMRFWQIAADLDVTENLTTITAQKSRYLSVGTEINVVNSPRFNLPLRAGIQKNLSNSNSGVSYTAGLGLNFFHFIVELAGQVSAKSTPIESIGGSEEIPNNAAASVQIAFLFGSKDQGGRDKKK